MSNAVTIVGGGLAGSEAALMLADFGFDVTLYEMRPAKNTDVHQSDHLAELVCSNSLKSTKPDSAAGMLKEELSQLNSRVYAAALAHRVPAGGALAVDRERFSEAVTAAIKDHPHIKLERTEVEDIAALAHGSDVVIVATGPLTSDALADNLRQLTGDDCLAFYDAAAPIVMADSLDMGKLFRQSRYEEEAGTGDYLNAPFRKEEYESFAYELVNAKRVIAKDFETKDLFQACQPVEEVMRKGIDAPRYGMLKPVGLTDPSTGRRPWAALQLRAEDASGCSYNLVGFQTNLTFSEQKRVFRMIPGLENAEFARFGVMHRNTYINAPKLLDRTGRLISPAASGLDAPVYIAGQLAGTEGYCEAVRSGLHAAISAAACLRGIPAPKLPATTAFGALMSYASDPATVDYQPMHVNFGIMPPFDQRIRNKKERYAAYAKRGQEALRSYISELSATGLMRPSGGRLS